MADKDNAVVDMRWLSNGEEDKHPDYVSRKRDDLAGAYISDDELAYMAAMMSTISDEQDMAKMMASHRAGGDGDYISKSMTGEIIKDRLRWLTRRVAVLEGRYPGKTVADLADSVPAPVMPHPVLGKKEDAFDAAVAESRLDRQVPLLVAVLNLPNGTHPNNMAALLEERRIKVDSLKVSVALGLFMDRKPLQRWQIYVGVARDLLKQGIYIPFWDDEYSVSGPNQNILNITKSKYFGTGKRYQITKLATMETPVVNASLADILGSDLSPGIGEYYKDACVDTENRTGEIDLKPYEPRAREIYDSWKDVEGWVPWVDGGNSLRQEQAFARAIHEAGDIEAGATSNHEAN